MFSGKVVITHLIAVLIKKIYKISYYPQLYCCIKYKIKIELDLSNYATNLT